MVVAILTTELACLILDIIAMALLRLCMSTLDTILVNITTIFTQMAAVCLVSSDLYPAQEIVISPNYNCKGSLFICDSFYNFEAS